MGKFFYTSIFITLVACSGQTQPPPKGILSKDQMIEYLIDLQITEAKIAALDLPEDTVKKFYGEIQQQLYRKHNITDSVYYKSLSYYLYTVKQMEDIYSAVVDSLSLRERLHKAN